MTKSGYTYDDLICLPGHINFGVHDVNLSTRTLAIKDGVQKWRSLMRLLGVNMTKDHFLCQKAQMPKFHSYSYLVDYLKIISIAEASPARSAWRRPLCLVPWTRWLSPTWQLPWRWKAGNLRLRDRGKSENKSFSKMTSWVSNDRKKSQALESRWHRVSQF